MADQDIVERVQLAFGGVGHMVTPRRRQEHWKMMYIYHCSRADELLPLLKRMVPMLSSRRGESAQKAIISLVNVRHVNKEAQHGLSRYTSRKHKCRCDICVAAMKAYHVAHRKMKKG